jgi:hypothetical protein
MNKKIKTSFLAAFLLAMVACTNSIPDSTNKNGLEPLPAKENFQDLDKEYTFTTKDLTGSYLLRKLEKWMDTGNQPSNPNGPKLLKEVLYARYKYSGLFCSVMEENRALWENIKVVSEISDREAIDPGFQAFIEGCAPNTHGEFQVNTYTTNNQNFPATAMDNNGNFVIVWEGSGAGDNNGVFARKYNNTGHPLGSVFLVNTTTFRSQVNADIAMDNNGDFVVVWDSYQDGLRNNIYAQRYHSDGSRAGSEFIANTLSTSSQSTPTVAMDDDGDFVIAWASNREGDQGIYAQRYYSDGTPNGSDFHVNTYTISSQSRPRAAMDSDGDFVITWTSINQEFYGSNYGVYAQRYDSNGTPSPQGEFLVNTRTTAGQGIQAVAMDGDGDFVVTWQSDYQDGNNTGVFAQRFNSSGGTAGSEFLVNSNTIQRQYQPAVAMDNNGDFVITWESYQQDGSGFGIYAQRYNSDGSKPLTNGSEFQVNFYTFSDQSDTAIAMNSSGQFVIAWDSFKVEGNFDLGVSAKKFNTDGSAVE